MRAEDFWSLTITELHWLFEARRPKKMYGDMTEDEVAEIYEEAYGNG